MIGRFEENTIYNEDCYKAIKDIPSGSIDLVYIDIPYLYTSANSKKKTIEEIKTDFSTLSKRMARKENSLKDIKIDSGIDYKILDELCRVMKRIYIYIWCSKLQINDLMNYFIDKGCTYEILVWCKTNPSPTTNNVWLPDLEYCLFFREKGCRLNDGYDLKSKWYISGANVDDKKLYDHPTIKPLELVKRHILHSTQPNDIVLDCFMGSGTTAVACKETGRRYLGFEIDKTYYEIACNRLKGYSQRDIEHKQKGQQDLFDFI